MNYLLDTCVLSELVKPLPHPTVIDWLTDTASDSLFLSAMTIGELRKGCDQVAEVKEKSPISALADDPHDRVP